jgi:hypothetical protein
MASVWGNAGEAEGTFGNNKLVIKKAAPGTFFVIVGAIIIGLTVYKGLNFESLTNSGVMQGEKPVLID